MKKILITNDDGYESEGLLALARALKPLGQVTVVAPTMEKSACGHSLTLTKPLHFVELEKNFYKLDDGTPSDCIFLSLAKLFPKDYRPDIVISGINIGSNMGEDITYSGTASAAMEAVLQGIPGIAISQVYKNHGQSIKELGYGLAQESIVTLVQKIFDGDFPLPSRKFLNINICFCAFLRQNIFTRVECKDAINRVSTLPSLKEKRLFFMAELTSVQRVIRILELLSMGRNLTSAELHREFNQEVTLRTIQRDMVTIQQAGIPVICEKNHKKDFS